VVVACPMSVNGGASGTWAVSVSVWTARVPGPVGNVSGVLVRLAVTGVPTRTRPVPATAAVNGLPAASVTVTSSVYSPSGSPVVSNGVSVTGISPDPWAGSVTAVVAAGRTTAPAASFTT